MKKTFIATLLFVLIGWSTFILANDGKNPVDMLESIANRMIAGLKSNKASLKTNPGVVYSLAYKIVVPHADLAEMSKRVLPPKVWNNASPSQRAKFESEFTKLLVRTYASALSDYSNQTVEFFPVRGGYQGKSTINVSSRIVRGDGPSISVTYRMVQTPAGWKLFDMSVEGVSLLESFRSQFADKLARGNIDDLIKQMAQHSARRGG